MSRLICLLMLLGMLLCTSLAVAGEPAQRLLFLGQSPDGHPRSTHEYLPGVKVLAHLLRDVQGLKVEVVNADEPWTRGPELIKAADGVVIFVSEGAKWLSADPRRKQAFADLASRGGGLTVLHWGMGTTSADNIPAFLKIAGGCHGGPDRRYKVVEVTTQFADHPIGTGIEDFQIREEFYYKLKFPKGAQSLKPVLQVPIEGQLETVSWAWTRPDGGRSFGFSGLHFHENWKRPEYRRLLAQGVMWTMKKEIPALGLEVGIDEKLLAVEKEQ